MFSSSRVAEVEGRPAVAADTARVANRDAVFDGLRGIAIALVLWHHLVEQALPPGRESWLGWLRAATNLSWCGVDLFFVISGFFIGGALIDYRESPRLARVFYLRRAVRILPLYYATLALTLGLGALGVMDSFRLFPPWIYGTFLTNFALANAQRWDWLPLSVLWSLAVEEQFYLLGPWIVRAISPARLPWLAGGAALVGWLLRAGLTAWRPDGWFGVQVLMPFRMDCLALGVLVAWILRNRRAGDIADGLGRRWKAMIAAGVGAILLLTLQRPTEGNAILCWYGYTMLSVFFSLIVAVVAIVRPLGLVRILSVPWLAHLGRHSYFIYLWHALIGVAIIRALGGTHFQLNSLGGAGTVALAIGVTWCAATVSWKFFEGPLVKWGHRHRY
jgi:peptidoglycan/LPS O-acetylase OafA/YrhL